MFTLAISMSNIIHVIFKQPSINTCTEAVEGRNKSSII